MRGLLRTVGFLVVASVSQAADVSTSAAGVAVPATDGCAGAETLFACPVKGGKEIRVCGAVGIPIWVGYTYGKPGAPDLKFPKVREDSANSFRHEERTTIQSMGNVLSFDNEGVTYEVTEMMGSGSGPDAEANNFAGVYVLQGTKQLAKVACAAPPVSNWTRVREILEAGTFSP